MIDPGDRNLRAAKSNNKGEASGEIDPVIDRPHLSSNLGRSGQRAGREATHMKTHASFPIGVRTSPAHTLMGVLSCLLALAGSLLPPVTNMPHERWTCVRATVPAPLCMSCRRSTRGSALLADCTPARSSSTASNDAASTVCKQKCGENQ